MNLSIRQYIIQEGYIIKNWKESDKSSMSDHRIVVGNRKNSKESQENKLEHTRHLSDSMAHIHVR